MSIRTDPDSTSTSTQPARPPFTLVVDNRPQVLSRVPGLTTVVLPQLRFGSPGVVDASRPAPGSSPSEVEALRGAVLRLVERLKARGNTLLDTERGQAMLQRLIDSRPSFQSLAVLAAEAKMERLVIPGRQKSAARTLEKLTRKAESISRATPDSEQSVAVELLRSTLAGASDLIRSVVRGATPLGKRGFPTSLDMDREDPLPVPLPPLEPTPVSVPMHETVRRERKPPAPLPSTTERPDVDPKVTEALNRTSDGALHEHFFRDQRWAERIRMLPKLVFATIGIGLVGLALKLGSDLSKAVRSLQEAGEERNRLIERGAEPSGLGRLDQEP